MDRVLAIVGDSVVLLSQVVQEENRMRSEGRQVPPVGTPQSDSVRKILLDDLVMTQLILQAAVQDTLLTVDDGRVEDALQQRMSQLEANFPSRAEMERVLRLEGLSVQSIREIFREQIAQQQMVGLYISRHGGQRAIEVTEEEVRAVFEAGRANVQERPATVTFKQVLLTVAPSDSSKAEALVRTEDLLERARAGEDFAELAMSHSQDPGSAPAGGDLGWFRKGNLADEFEEAAFRLIEGAISDVVETGFGYHIILVERVRFAERKARHILIRPEVAPGDISRTRALAGELRARAQVEDFQAIIDEHHDSSMPDSATVPQRQVAQLLAPAYVAALGGREAGELVGPIQFLYNDQERFAILKILEVREAGAYTYEDLEQTIRTSLMEKKRVDALVEGLRAKTYVEIKGN